MKSIKSFVNTAGRYKETIVLILTPLILLYIPLSVKSPNDITDEVKTSVDLLNKTPVAKIDISNGKALNLTTTVAPKKVMEAQPMTQRQANCMYVLLIMAVYWSFEVMPLAVTGMIPIVMMPLLGVVGSRAICMSYLKDANMMYVGGLIVAVAIEKWDLHKRIALRIIMLVGPQPKWLMLGFMVPTWFFSMWISNTATAAMMIPIVNAVLDQMTFSRRLSVAIERRRSSQLSRHSGGSRASLRRHRTTSESSQRSVGRSMNSPPRNLEGIKETQDEDIEEHIINEMGEEMIPVEDGEMIPLKEVEKVPEAILNIGNDQLNQSFKEGSPPPDTPKPETSQSMISKGLSLSICFSASVGGIGTLTGTPPNVILKAEADKLFLRETGSANSGVSFGTWMLFATPMALVALVICWLWLVFMFVGFRTKTPKDRETRVRAIIQNEYEKLGSVTFAEKCLMIHFVGLALLWLTRKPEIVPGWGDLLPKGFATDATPAIFVAILLFICPAERPRMFRCKKDEANRARKGQSGPVKPLLDWQTVQTRFPWGVVLLVGGGFALATATAKSGLSEWIGGQLVTVISSVPKGAMVLVLCALVAPFTNVSSNVATATLLLPILAEVAIKMCVNPLYFMIPAAVSCSFAFMLPVSTPPNAVVFSYGKVTVADMLRSGFGMNVVCLFICVAANELWGVPIFGMDKFPWHEPRCMSQSTPAPSVPISYNATL